MHATSLSRAFGMAIAFAALTASAQLPQYALNRIQEEDGLLTVDVINTARDAKGILWIATQSAVFGFDGKHTLRYSFNETINRIFVDAAQRKWVNTRAGLYLLNEGAQQFHFIPFSGAGKGESVQWYEDDNKKICAFSKGKHFLFDESKQQFFLNILPFANATLRINRYNGRHQHWTFYSNGDSIIRYHPSQPLRIIPLKNINGVYVLNGDEALVSDNRYQSYYANFSNGVVRLLESSSHHRFGEKMVLFSHAPVNENLFWFAGNKGLFQYDTKTGAILRPVIYYGGKPFENQSSYGSLTTDNKGTLYMSGADGIFMLSKTSGFIQHVRSYKYGAETLPNNNVRSIAEDEEGKIWLGTTGGIAELNPATGALKSFNPLNGKGLTDYPSYRQLLADGDLLWLGTSGNGIWYYNRKTGVCRRPVFVSTDKISTADFEQQYIWKLVLLANGNLLATTDKHLFLIDRKTFNAKAIPYNIPEGISRSAVQDASGRIWLGTTEGLSCFDTSFNVMFRLRDSLPDGRVAAFCEWKPNHMLLGSRGFFEVKTEGKKIISFVQKTAFPGDQFIYCMKQDKQGTIWLGTDDGLYRYNPLKDDAIRFDATDGVQSQAFNSDGAFLSSDNFMYMGGKNGLNYFRPDAYTPLAETLQPFVLSFSVAVGDSIYNRLPQQIPYYGRNLDFIISAPELKKPFRVQYRYRLRNDDEWTSNGFNNHVRISSLKPDDYNLQVAAGYDGKEWFDSKEILSFSVGKPWWQTGWFRVACGAVIAFGIWQWNLFRQRRRKNAEMKKLMEYFTYSGSADASVELILWDIARNCISHLGFEDCVIYLLDEQRNVLVQKAAYGNKAPAPFLLANPIEIPVGQGITGTVAQSGEAVVVRDTAKDSRYIVDDIARLSELAVPLVDNGRVIGVIDSEHTKKNFFTGHHLKALQTVASLCSSKIAAAMALEAMRKAESEWQLLDAKMNEAKFANLRLQMNPHFLFNILTTIQYLIVSSQVTKARHYVDVFSGFLRSLLNHAEDTVVSLEEELRILQLYVELESLCLDETFVWEAQLSDDVEAAETVVPFMILQPFVENAIHHGLMNKVGEKKFFIRIHDAGDDSVQVVIEDNGVGRKASAGINGRTLSTVLHPSKGIGIVEQRLQLLQQKTGKQSNFTIQDLEHDNKPSGTRVTLLLPHYETDDA